MQGYEARLRCKDGSICHVLINSSVYCETENSFTRAVHSRHYARKEMERDLREAKNR